VNDPAGDAPLDGVRLDDGQCSFGHAQTIASP
jgi:hypothetical protein